MRTLVLSFFKLIFRVSSKFTPNIIYKSPRVTKTCTKEKPKFVSKNRNVCLYIEFIIALILSSISTDTVLKKRFCKQSRIIANSLGSMQRVITLLIELIAIWVRFS